MDHARKTDQTRHDLAAEAEGSSARHVRRGWLRAENAALIERLEQQGV